MGSIRAAVILALGAALGTANLPVKKASAAWPDPPTFEAAMKVSETVNGRAKVLSQPKTISTEGRDAKAMIRGYDFRYDVVVAAMPDAFPPAYVVTLRVVDSRRPDRIVQDLSTLTMEAGAQGTLRCGDVVAEVAVTELQ